MTSWSQNRSGAGKFAPENIDPKLCTHVIYAFGTLKDHKLTLNEEKDKNEAGKFEALIQLREKNPDIKVKENSNLLILGNFGNKFLDKFSMKVSKKLLATFFNSWLFISPQILKFLFMYSSVGIPRIWYFFTCVTAYCIYLEILGVHKIIDKWRDF